MWKNVTDDSCGLKEACDEFQKKTAPSSSNVTPTSTPDQKPETLVMPEIPITPTSPESKPEKKPDTPTTPPTTDVPSKPATPAQDNGNSATEATTQSGGNVNDLFNNKPTKLGESNVNIDLTRET